MRASELIGCTVYDAAGVEIGVVHDLRFVVRSVADGTTQCELDALECGGVGAGHRLGFGHGSMKGPWPLPAVFRAMADRSLVVEWRTVVRFARPRIELSVGRDALTTVRDEREHEAST